MTTHGSSPTIIAAGIITEHHDELRTSEPLQDALDDRHVRFLRW
jgi:hypothetical protein